MKHVKLSLLLSIFFVISLSAQHNISYGVWIPIDCDPGSTRLDLAGGSGFEGDEFTIPSFKVPPEYQMLGDEFKNLQLIANAFAGAKIGIPEGTLNEDVALEIDLTSAKCGTPFNNLRQAFSFTIQVVGDSTGAHDPFTYYQFNEGKEAYIKFNVENLTTLFEELEMGPKEILGWFSKELEPDFSGIRFVGTDTSFTLYLSHFSKIIIGTSTSTTGLNTISEIPSSYNLAQNYPNPFNPTTKISFSLPKSGFTKLTIYNSIGVEIKTVISEEKNAGIYELTFDASELTSGIYFYDLISNNFRSTKKMILIK